MSGTRPYLPAELHCWGRLHQLQCSSSCLLGAGHHPAATIAAQIRQALVKTLTYIPRSKAVVHTKYETVGGQRPRLSQSMPSCGGPITQYASIWKVVHAKEWHGSGLPKQIRRCLRQVMKTCSSLLVKCYRTSARLAVGLCIHQLSLWPCQLDMNQRNRLASGMLSRPCFTLLSSAARLAGTGIQKSSQSYLDV